MDVCRCVCGCIRMCVGWVWMCVEMLFCSYLSAGAVTSEVVKLLLDEANIVIPHGNNKIQTRSKQGTMALQTEQ